MRAASITLYRGQQRTFGLVFWQPGKTDKIDLTDRSVTVLDNTLPTFPIVTILDPVNGYAKIELSADEDVKPLVYSFRIRVGEGTDDELDWPPIEVSVK